MLDGWSVCIGAKSSGDCQVASARRSIGGDRKCVAVVVRGQHGGGRLGRPEIPGVAGEGGL